MWTAATLVPITIIVLIITGLIMSKRSIYTTITPLPAGVSRETVLETIHCHTEMISLNPSHEEYHPIKPPAKASPEEYHCQWYEITDTVQYLPGGLLSGSVSFNACFHDLADGVQTHIYAPMGLEIRGRWTIGGTLPGEPQQPVEIGKGIPLSGLYLREDSIVKCNILMAGIVKKNLKHSHATLVQRILARAQIQDATRPNELRNVPTAASGTSLRPTPQTSPGRLPPPPPADQSLYPAPLNPRNQNCPAVYAQPSPRYSQQYDPRFSSQSHGGVAYQYADPSYAAMDPHWQPQVPMMAQTYPPYAAYPAQQQQQQQTGFATGPQEPASVDRAKKRESKGGIAPAGPPAHPGPDPAELQ